MSNELIIAVVLGIVALVLIKVAKSILFKVIGFILIIPVVLIVLYITDTGPFSNNLLSREHLKATFCETDLQDALCMCVAKPYIAMIEGKFSPAELDEIESKNYETAYVFGKLYDSLKIQVGMCSGNADSAAILMQSFSTKLLPTGEKTSALAAWIMEKGNGVKNSNSRLKELDEKL